MRYSLGFRELSKIYSGHESVKSFREARSSGFTNKEEYIEARSAGFSNAGIFEEAKKAGITNSDDYNCFLNDREKSKEIGFSCFEYYALIHDFLNHKQFPKRAIQLKKEIERRAKSKYGNEYIFSDEFINLSESTIKFINGIKSEKPLSDIVFDLIDGITLHSTEDIHRKVVVDASNICWYERNTSGFNSQGKLPAVDLLEMKNLLSLYGASSILLIADANLPHEVDDPSILKVLEDSHDLIYSHGEQSDKMLLSFSENRGFLILSNDQYRDWNLDPQTS